MVSFTGKLGRSGDSLHRYSSVLDQVLKKDQNMESINESVSFNAVSVSYVPTSCVCTLKELSCFKAVVKALNVQQSYLTVVLIIACKFILNLLTQQ